MTAPRVVPLQAAHRARVEEILRATGAFREEEVAVALELVDDATGCTPSGDYECVGTFDACGTLAGYACFGPTPDTDGTFDLYWIATDPTLHGSGFGRILLDGVERAIAQRAGRLLVAETSTRADYASTRAFYDRAGFTEAGTVADFYGPGDGRALFTRRIASVGGVPDDDVRHARDARDRTDVNGTARLHPATDGRIPSIPTRAPDGRGAAVR